MPLPHAVARFNKRVTNRCIEPLVRRFGGYAVVHHTGRRSGRPYRTPVHLFPLAEGREVVVVLTYGLRADWCRNVMAGGGVVQHHGLTRTIEAATVVGPDVARPALPAVVRVGVRLLRVDRFLRLSFAPTVDQPDSQ